VDGDALSFAWAGCSAILRKNLGASSKNSFSKSPLSALGCTLPVPIQQLRVNSRMGKDSNKELLRKNLDRPFAIGGGRQGVPRTLSTLLNFFLPYSLSFASLLLS